MYSITNLKRKITIIVVAHRLSTVNYCDKLFKIENGSIVNNGTYNKIFDKI